MTFRLAVTALAVAVSSAVVVADQGHPQKKKKVQKPVVTIQSIKRPDIAPATSWGKSDLPPMKLAQLADQTLHNMRSTSMDYIFQFRLPVGYGTTGGLAAIKDQGQFRIEYPKIGDTEEIGLRRMALIAKNGKLSTILETTRDGERLKPVVQPIPGYRPLPSNLLAGWMEGNVASLFTAVGSKTNPLEQLVTAASKTPGFQVTSQSRRYTIANKIYSQYRIVVTRSKAQEKKLGGLFYEVDINPGRWLPVSMTNLENKGKKSYYTSMHGTRWDPRPNQTYPAQTFNQGLLHLSTK